MPRVSRRPAALGGNLRPWKKGTSGNPRGRPPKGQSWAELIRQVGDMTGPEVADHIEQTLRRSVDPMTLKHLVVIRAFVSLVNEPSASLMGQLIDRSEGKVREAEQEGSKPTILGYQEMLERVYGRDRSGSGARRSHKPPHLVDRA